MAAQAAGASQHVEGRPRQGPVRAEGRAVADSGGAFNALGATLFWGAWGYKFDRPRLERNLAALSAAGVDYVRVLGSVGGTSWQDRETDPRWTDYDEIVGGMTDLTYDKYGMRVQWTLFGGAPFTESPTARDHLVDRFGKLVRGREHKVFALEIANEARSNGFAGEPGIAELRRLGKRLNDQTAVLVALSAPGSGAACETYAGAGADVATIHYARTGAGDGPWDYPARYDSECPGQLPLMVFNNEPIGPESSVRQDDDPGRIAAAYVLTFLAHNAAYVLHAGPGIRGGGQADVTGKLSRHAHFDELPSFKPIVTALKEARKYLPAGLANWTRHDLNAPDAPIEGADRIYSASSESAFIALIQGAEKPRALRARKACSIVVRDVSTGRIVQKLDASPGQPIALKGNAPMVLIGRTK